MNLELVREHITPTIVLDIGANQGHWTKEAQKVWPEAYYFCVESNKECEFYLCQLNATYQIATLSDSVKSVTFYSLKDCHCATGASYYREQTEYFNNENTVETTVETKTLDDICAPIDYKDSTLLAKLDVQGSELDVLKGGENVLNATAGLIIELSYSQYNEGAPLAAEVDAYLDGKGFKPVVKLEDICHPVSREIIQQDWYYARV